MAVHGEIQQEDFNIEGGGELSQSANYCVMFGCLYGSGRLD